MKHTKLFFLVLPIVTLILEILPFGAVLNFGNPEGEPIRQTFSYFSLTPFGYANFAPLLTAILTCVILVMLVIYYISENYRLAVALRYITGACIVLSLCPLIFGISYFSVLGFLITLSLTAELLLLCFAVKKPIS